MCVCNILIGYGSSVLTMSNNSDMWKFPLLTNDNYSTWKFRMSLLLEENGFDMFLGKTPTSHDKAEIIAAEKKCLRIRCMSVDDS